jgi:phospholipase/lecithinase/hemolysin
MVQEYNTQISTSATTFESTHPGTKSMVFDTYAYLSQILEHPAKFSITNTTSFCPRFDAPDIATNFAAYGCSPIQDYFWYNTGHITFRIHQLLAEAVSAFLLQQSHS